MPLPFGAYDLSVFRQKIDFPGFAKRVTDAYEARASEDPLLSRREIERRAGVQPGTMQKWENGDRGKKLSVDALRGLAVALEVNEDWLGWGHGARDVVKDAVTLEPKFLARYPTLDDEQRAIVHAIYLRNPSANIEQVAQLINIDTTVKALEQRVRTRAMSKKAKASPKSSRRAPASSK